MVTEIDDHGMGWAEMREAERDGTRTENGGRGWHPLTRFNIIYSGTIRTCVWFHVAISAQHCYSL